MFLFFSSGLICDSCTFLYQKSQKNKETAVSIRTLQRCDSFPSLQTVLLGDEKTRRSRSPSNEVASRQLARHILPPFDLKGCDCHAECLQNVHGRSKAGRWEENATVDSRFHRPSLQRRGGGDHGGQSRKEGRTNQCCVFLLYFLLKTWIPYDPERLFLSLHFKEMETENRWSASMCCVFDSVDVGWSVNKVEGKIKIGHEFELESSLSTPQIDRLSNTRGKNKTFVT